MLSQVTGLPAAFYQKEAKSCMALAIRRGASLKGRSFVLIEDVVSSAAHLSTRSPCLKADGLWPVRALCVIDRESGGKEALARAGLELKSLFTYSQIIHESKEGSAQWKLACSIADFRD